MNRMTHFVAHKHNKIFTDPESHLARAWMVVMSLEDVVETRTPEARCLFAIITQALLDLAKAKENGGSFIAGREVIDQESVESYLVGDGIHPVAHILGISPDYLTRKMQQHGLVEAA